MIDKWILSRLSLMVATVNEAFLHRNLHVATAAIKQFFYREFCDWYLVSIFVKQELQQFTIQQILITHL